MNPAPVAIVDYGMGNLRSVQNAVEHLGGHAVFVSDPMQLRQYQKIILPGVGAFSQAITCLRETGLDVALSERRDAGAHILGICLGMQLMCTVSEEDGIHQGLDWFSAKVSRFPADSGLSVPHMGWNGVDFSRDDPMFAKLESGSDAYFVHSYRVECSDPADVIATTDYGHRFDSIIQRGNVRGIQFHPEKSQGFGLGMIRNYVELPC
ncbi:imidazole glycerol phosphate synthase subunit HisH [Polaromonas sp. A23]|uniref:imidazole glycerol phosphate synthase subunit HisH n=1 Tax=Polaromonas sp. A23 TaxID=1944133 RepID=UPI00098496F1|nr:imidazole glycerol phosphate synthase subunit HisH [Polaromonas sp. A23]OOG44656.1 imidazole glycerol phosphate synthase subunit HisH [Polaromonas sp. A23]